MAFHQICITLTYLEVIIFIKETKTLNGVGGWIVFKNPVVNLFRSMHNKNAILVYSKGKHIKLKKKQKQKRNELHIQGSKSEMV